MSIAMCCPHQWTQNMFVTTKIGKCWRWVTITSTLPFQNCITGSPWGIQHCSMVGVKRSHIQTFSALNFVIYRLQNVWVQQSCNLGHTETGVRGILIVENPWHELWHFLLSVYWFYSDSKSEERITIFRCADHVGMNFWPYN